MDGSDNTTRYTWLHDTINANLVQLHAIKQVLYSGKTEFQSVEIVDTWSFGICLVLDGKIQSAESDEFIYHEALVHPAMLTHPNPKSVFIAGGGEGATLREVLIHNTVEHVTMVDIDEQVMDICRRLLPAFHQNAFDDSRVIVHATDARKYLEVNKDTYDVIVIDLVEPLEAGPACLLYTQEFYTLVKQRLNEGGIMCVQSGAAGWNNLSDFLAIVNTLRSVFSIVSPYQAYVPSFVDVWGFNTASMELEPRNVSPDEIDRSISTRLSKELRFLEGKNHAASFVLPKYLQQESANTNRIITDADPLYLY